MLAPLIHVRAKKLRCTGKAIPEVGVVVGYRTNARRGDGERCLSDDHHLFLMRVNSPVGGMLELAGCRDGFETDTDSLQ